MVGVGGAVLAGLDELSALEAVVASSPLPVPVLVSAGGLPLLLVFFASRLLTLSNGRMWGEQ